MRLWRHRIGTDLGIENDRSKRSGRHPVALLVEDREILVREGDLAAQCRSCGITFLRCAISSRWLVSTGLAL